MNKELFNYYQEMINSIANDSKLSKETLANIAEIGILHGYNNKVSEQLYLNNYLYEFIQISLWNETEIPYDEEQILATIKENKAELLKDKSLFRRLRENICKINVEILPNYIFLFDDEAPLIAEGELAILGNSIDSDINILKVIQHSLVTEDDADFLIEFFNRKYHKNNESFEILKHISKYNEEVAKIIFYSLNFEKFKYCLFSREKKSIIRTLFENILDLNTNTARIKFMKTTSFIEEDWESYLSEELIEDEELRKEYIEAVNSCKRINNHTINTLVKLGTIYPMSETVNEKFWLTKNYIYYVISKTLANKRFVLETGERLHIIWSTYIEIFSEQLYTNTCNYMSKNIEFLYKIQEQLSYKGMPQNARKELSSIRQSSSSLIDVYEYGREFALQYFCEIDGFLDEHAATTFVDIVTNDDYLLSSQKLYDHTHEKLVNGRLKFKYTMSRKRI